METYCISPFSGGDDQGPDNMDPTGGRVYFGLQFEGKVHRGGQPSWQEFCISHPKAERGILVFSSLHSMGSQPMEGHCQYQGESSHLSKSTLSPMDTAHAGEEALFPSSH